MTRQRTLRPRERRLIADLDEVFTPRRRPNLAVVVWNWRYELGLAVATAGTVTGLIRLLGVEWGIVSASALVGVFGPPWPEQLVDWAWRLVTPHRLRVGFGEARLRTTRGKLPIIIRTTHAPFGERVEIWCPAGISAEDIKSARYVLRSACWAADIRVARDERRSHRVTVDVIRHPEKTGDR